MESKIAYTLNRRIIKNFMDIIILKHLRNNDAMGGYDVIQHLYRRFHILPSPGTIYSLLYALERRSLIEGKMIQGKRVYKLTDQGEKFLAEISVVGKYLKAVLLNIFGKS